MNDIDELVDVFFKKNIDEEKVNFIQTSKIIKCLIQLIKEGPIKIVAKAFQILVKYHSKG